MTKEQSHEPKAKNREFLKYTFFKIDRQWKLLSNKTRTKNKVEFSKLVDRDEKILTRTYSLMGTRGDTDFLIWNITKNLEDLQSFTSKILKSSLGLYLTIPYSYLAITRQSEYLGEHHHEGQEGLEFQSPGNAKYLFVYPFVKKREWYFLPHQERTTMMAQHFKIGHKYPSIKIHTGYSFGLDDPEFVLAFEGDQPADFSELVMELRSSEASKYTALETPIFTCLTTQIRDILDLIG